MDHHLPLELGLAAGLACCNLPDPQTPAQNLVKLIKQLIKEEHYEGVALLFTSESESSRNIALMSQIAMELLHDVCLQYLNQNSHEQNLSLYICAEELLKVIAAHAPEEELLLELLELVEEQKSEYVFTSALRALQTVLLRLGDRKPRALEWSLNSVQSCLEELPLPEYLKQGYDHEQQVLLEQNEQVQKLLMYYVTVGLFYEPILTDVLAEIRPPTQIFHNRSINRRNVLCCFFVQLVGKPLALLDLTRDGRRSNAYTMQCATGLTQAATKCIVDPFYMLSLAEPRVRWKRRLDAAKGVYEMSSSNIFLIEEKLPLHAVAIYIYMLLVENVKVESAIPLVYAPLYVFEAGLYLASELLHHDEPPLQYRGVLLAKELLLRLNNTPIPAVFLELELNKDFCYSLCNIVGYSSQLQLRQVGVQLLRKYILQFDNEGKYLLLKNLLHSITHIGISGYLATLYKDLVADALLTPKMLPASFSGKDFRAIFLNNICKLPQGAETDLMEYSDKVISSLNALRFFAIKDCQNRTGFWDFFEDIQQQYLTPLRNGLDLSIAHYKAEQQRVKSGEDMGDAAAEREQLQLLDIAVANAASADTEKVNVELDRAKKLQILNQTLCTFDLMRSLLARTTELIEHSAKAYKMGPFSDRVCK